MGIISAHMLSTGLIGNFTIATAQGSGKGVDLLRSISSSGYQLTGSPLFLDNKESKQKSY